jgi:hypothetical protein
MALKRDDRKAKRAKKLFVQEENKYALHVRNKNVDMLTTKLDE